MDKFIQKNIDIHLSEKVLTDYVEILKNLMMPPVAPQVLQQVVTEQTNTESHGSVLQEGADGKEVLVSKNALNVGDPIKDTVVKERHQGQTYERFISEGQAHKTQGKEADLLTILGEIETESQGPHKMSLHLNNPAPAEHKEFTERDGIYVEEDEDDDEGSAQQGEEDDEDEGDDDDEGDH